LSAKDSNPSPDDITDTAARWAEGKGQGGGFGAAGVDAYLYQVVEGHGDELAFQTWWVVLYIEQATVTIYGGESASGPWKEVWVPLLVTPETDNNRGQWGQTPLQETRLDREYPFYKVELHGRYPEGRVAGVKYTGVYFTSREGTGEPEPPPRRTQEVTASPTSGRPTSGDDTDAGTPVSGNPVAGATVTLSMEVRPSSQPPAGDSASPSPHGGSDPGSPGSSGWAIFLGGLVVGAAAAAFLMRRILAP
jgi:hypothetical protein